MLSTAKAPMCAAAAASPLRQRRSEARHSHALSVPVALRSRAARTQRPEERPEERAVARRLPATRGAAFCSASGDVVGSGAPASPPLLKVPRGPEETAQQALAACLRAHRDGVQRQRVELLLPLIGATDLDDWPGGIQQQFKAILPMVESILKGLKAEEALAGPLEAQIIDQGDAVGQWKGSKLGAVVFPTSQTLKNVRSLVEEGSRLVLMVNPQWQSGQVISDFGIGPWRKAAEDLVATFEETYHLSQTRVSGDEVRILRSYPGKWQIHAVDASGDIPCVAIEDTKPSYARLEELLKAVPGSNSSKPWDERLRAELQFNQDSLKPPQ